MSTSQCGEPGNRREKDHKKTNVGPGGAYQKEQVQDGHHEDEECWTGSKQRLRGNRLVQEIVPKLELNAGLSRPSMKFVPVDEYAPAELNQGMMVPATAI